ncbi:MAG: hypothetical protein WC843_05920 [Candidatus Gracilibacteria bacterium]
MASTQLKTTTHFHDAPISVIGRKIAFSTLVQYAGKFVQFFLSALILKQISNFLSENNYATYGAVMEFALFFSTAANLGIFANVIRKMAEKPKSGKTFFNALVLRIMTSGLLFVSAGLYLWLSGSDRIFILASLIFLVSLFFDYVTSVCEGMLQANYLMGRGTFALVIGKFLTAVGTFLVIKEMGGAVAGVGAIGSAGAGAAGAGANVEVALLLFFTMSVVGSLVTMGVSLFFVLQKFAREKVKITFALDKNFLWEIFKTSLPYGVIIISNSLYFRFLPDYFSHEALTGAQFAAFNVSFRVAQVLSLLSTFLMFSALPGLKQYLAEKDWKKARVLYKRLFWLMTVGGALVVVFGSLLGPWLIQLLTHQKYFLPEFWYLLPMMLILVAVSYVYDLVILTLFAFEDDIWIMKREFLAVIVSVIFFGGSLLIENLNLKLLFILLGAIAGETAMVIMCGVKVRKMLKKPA